MGGTPGETVFASQDGMVRVPALTHVGKLLKGLEALGSEYWRCSICLNELEVNRMLILTRHPGLET